MDTEPPRQALDFGLSAIGGSIFWGLYHLTSLWRAGKAVEPRHVVRAVMTVAAGILMGLLAAVFLGPSLAGLVPIAGLRDAHVVGFAIGAVAWEAAPFLFRGLRAFGAKKAKELGQ
jgi:hypothetical protein